MIVSEIPYQQRMNEKRRISENKWIYRTTNVILEVTKDSEAEIGEADDSGPTAVPGAAQSLATVAATQDPSPGLLPTFSFLEADVTEDSME